MSSLPDVSIIGTGALGRALAKALHARNVNIISLFNRNPEKAEIIAETVDANIWGKFPRSIKQMGSLVFITVPDDAIKKVVKKLASLSTTFDGYTIIHCSGNKSLEVLKPLSQKKAHTASFHPLQTFTRYSTAEIFEGIYFDIEGNDKSIKMLGDMADVLGAEWFEITAEEKPFLHAAAVMASNYLVVLMELSGNIAALGKMDEEKVRTALLPLVEETLENTSAEDLSSILTGPIARGDIKTVREHLKIMEQNPSVLSLYRRLGKKALELARKGNKLGPEADSVLDKLLSAE